MPLINFRNCNHKAKIFKKIGDLIKLALIVMILCGLVHTAFAEESEITPTEKSQKITVQKKQKSEVLIQKPDLQKKQKSVVSIEEDAFREAQRCFDRSLTILTILTSATGVAITLLAILIAVAIALGLLEMRKWRKFRKEAEEAAGIAKKESETIMELKRRMEDQLNKSRKEIKETPPLSATEKPSEELKERIDEFSRRLDLLELFGIPLKSEDFDKRASHFYYTGNYESSLINIEKAIELDPDNARLWVNKSLLLNRLNRHGDALPAAEKAINLDPDNYSAWESKALALSKLNRHGDALSAMEEGIKKRPNYPGALSNQVVILTKLGRYPEAKKVIDEIIKIDPDFSGAWYNRACIYSLEGDKENCLVDLKKAIELNPDHKKEAKEDEDFKSLWDDEDFKKLVE